MGYNSCQLYNYILRLQRQFARKPPLLSQILLGFVLIFFQNSMYICVVRPSSTASDLLTEGILFLKKLSLDWL